MSIENLEESTDLRSFPLVSVLVPTYNADKFVEECLDSILAQGYPNLEVLVSDDCSGDGTQSLLQIYAEKYPDIINLNINKVNQGVSKNMNILLSMSKGEYLVFFAGDDVMLPGKIVAQVELMESDPECVLCYHDVEVFYTASDKGRERIGSKVKFIEGWLPEVLERYCKTGVFNHGISNMARREFVPLYDERFVSSDILMWVNILEKSKGKIRFLDKVYALYRRHGENISGRIELLEEELLVYCYILARFPAFGSKIMHRIAIVYRSYRRYSKKHYSQFLRLSLKFSFNFKALLGLFLYYLTFSKFRL